MSRPAVALGGTYTPETPSTKAYIHAWLVLPWETRDYTSSYISPGGSANFSWDGKTDGYDVWTVSIDSSWNVSLKPNYTFISEYSINFEAWACDSSGTITNRI